MTATTLQQMKSSATITEGVPEEQGLPPHGPKAANTAVEVWFTAEPL